VTALAHSGGWSLAATMALALLGLFLRDGHRRALINEALHELRRPLQAIALSADPGRGGAAGSDGSVRLAASALERLDRVVNGGRFGLPREAVRFESLLRSAVGRWRARVALDGGSLELRWWAGEATVEGDRDALERAVDNLIVNAIEHGGPAIVVEGRRREGSLRIVVADSGFAAPRPRRPGLADDSDRGRSQVGRGVRGRRGHGLAVVRRVAAEHRGRFVLRRLPSGSMAVLEVPLRQEPGEPAAHA
jgi:signal transduction histidine kinase